MPFGPVVMGGLSFQIRAAGGVDATLAQLLVRELRAPDARIRVPVALPYDQLRQVELYPSRVMASVSGTFGLLALLLTVVGMYGVVMYSVSQRTREFAVRLALGARPQDILRGVLSQGLVMTGLGVAVGTGIALALGRVLRGFLFGVSTSDPITFAGWTGALVVIALVAAYVPARRVTKIDPAAALTGRS